MSKAISVYEVFSLMSSEAWDYDNDRPKEFGFKYVNSKGELRMRARIRKHVRTAKALKQKAESTHSSRGNYDRAIKGLFMIYDLDTDENRDIQASQIMYFRNHGSKEWLPIKN